ncbi:MAG: NAD(P)-dependent glycerol-3-phosphate dehydrogenase [Actinobacteria bacterium]|nr:NAD(P)-dependent glycerol-3-phosphate dehydrogenase [Actinomycetota bacterium]
MEQNRVAVMGTGSWGTVFAKLLDENLIPVNLWGSNPELLVEIAATRTNPKYHPELKFSKMLNVASNPKIALQDAQLVVLAMPAQRLRINLNEWAADIGSDAIVVSLIKGLEHDSGKRVSEVVAEFIPNKFAVISGPNLSSEIAAGQFAAATVASADSETALLVQQLCSSEKYKLFRTNDVTGVEVAGTTKNIIALATGIIIGLGLGENSQAAIMTRGLAEMVRIGVAVGGHHETFLGLAGIGDLIATSQSAYSRNRSFGVLVGEGKSISTAMSLIGQTVEAMKSTEPILQIAQKHHISVPIISHVANILNGKYSASSMLEVFQNESHEEEVIE